MSESEPTKPRRTRRQKVFAVLPTLLTLSNAACGFAAVTITAKVGPEHFGGSELITASQLIFLAMLFDALDGSAARLTQQTSDFGAQLDSLCDAISFGLAPAFIFLQLSHPDHRLMDSLAEQSLHFHPRLLWAIAVLFMTCAILRLARFNVETDEEDSHEFFSGLPSPAAAGVVASLPIGLRELREHFSPGGRLSFLEVQWIWPVMVILVPLVTLAAAVLMVSKLRYSHVFNQMIRGRRGAADTADCLHDCAAVCCPRTGDSCVVLLVRIFCTDPVDMERWFNDNATAGALFEDDSPSSLNETG